MKISKGYIPTAFKVREKKTGRTLDCFIQEYDNLAGEKYTRFNIGVNGWNEWNFICYVSESDFNEQYEVI